MRIARLPATVVEQYKHMIDHCCIDQKQFRFRLGKYKQIPGDDIAELATRMCRVEHKMEMVYNLLDWLTN